MKSSQLKVYIHTYLQSRYHTGLKTTNKYSQINERIQEIKKPPLKNLLIQNAANEMLSQLKISGLELYNTKHEPSGNH